MDLYNIKGFILSNISHILLLEKFFKNKKLNFIANYTFNIFNYETIKQLKNLGLTGITISPELDKRTISNLCDINNLYDIYNFRRELIIYGKIPLMNLNYCLLGNSNKCYPECDAKCKKENNYYLKDKINFNFRIISDNIQTITTLYNSKITSISPTDFNIDVARIDILDENISEINNIINNVKTGKRMEGKEFTKANLNKKI